LLKSSRPVQFDDVYVVWITDTDYRDPGMFAAQSPLKPGLVVDLIRAVSSLAPKVIGVDLDTKDSAWRSAIDQNCRATNGPLPEPTVVWAHMPVEPRGLQSDSSGEKPIQLYQLFGGLEGCQQTLSGVPRFPLDADGVVLAYVDEFTIDPDQRKKSLARVIAGQYGRAYQSVGKKRILNFAAYDPKHSNLVSSEPHCPGTPTVVISAKQLCAVAGTGRDCREYMETLSRCDQQNALAWKQNVRGKIVLLGGAFEDARDTYRTPMGPMHGVDLNAPAIESDLHPGAIRLTPLLYGFVADLLAGTFVVWVFWFFESRPTLALILGTLGVGAISLFISWALFRFLAAWFSLIPVLVGVNLHQYYEHLRGTWKAQRH
jgi:CHASE2 domain-containing sensor protein